jgi:hypothetical protein
MKFIEHTIRDGDRWDLLAYKFWGDSNLAPLLVVDNRHLSVFNDLPEGELCYIREKVEGEDSLVTNEELPFWKR